MARNADLKACGRLYAAMDAAVLNTVRSLDATKAEKLRRAVNRLTQVNCWWAEYRVKTNIQFALEQRGRERRAMKKRRTTKRAVDSREKDAS